ncbi:MAG: IS1380 family transposase [Planctomycetes bacterium]|nr:IS1380 family transposase [Planctomycetota bacterium]
MKTECIPTGLDCGRLGRRKITLGFDGGKLSSDGGAILLRMTEQRTGILSGFATDCFRDHRLQTRVEHSVEDLLAQRVLGYEDLNDHDQIRHDPLFAVAVGKQAPEGRTRRAEQGPALASSATLNRLELATQDHERDRYKKIELDFEAADRFFVRQFLKRSGETPPPEIVFDLDNSDIRLHGNQEGRFFHAYYRSYCYLPLYVFCGDHLLAAHLQTADKDGAKDAIQVCKVLVAEIRAKWPATRIVLRGDSGFCRDALLSWCESEGLDYVVGLARNSRLQEVIADELALAEDLFESGLLPARVYADFDYETLDSWSRPRRVVGKAEHLEKGSNPRFIVTSMSRDEVEADVLYEHGYCPRGEMENRIKELFGTRTSGATLHANQIRLYFSGLAYVLVQALRDLGLAGTSLAKARADTIRVKLLKIAARVEITVRRVWIRLSSTCPFARAFQEVHERLLASPQIVM